MAKPVWEGERMKHRRLVALMMAAVFVGALTTTARAETKGNNPLSVIATGFYSAIATAIGGPVKFVTCGTLAVVGGVGHGLTVGESEFVQEEFLSAIPSACDPSLKTLPANVTPYLDGPQPDDMAW